MPRKLTFAAIISAFFAGICLTFYSLIVWRFKSTEREIFELEEHITNSPHGHLDASQLERVAKLTYLGFPLGSKVSDIEGLTEQINHVRWCRLCGDGIKEFKTPMPSALPDSPSI